MQISVYAFSKLGNVADKCVFFTQLEHVLIRLFHSQIKQPEVFVFMVLEKPYLGHLIMVL